VRRIDGTRGVYKMAAENVGRSYATFSAVTRVRAFFLRGGCRAKEHRSDFAALWAFLVMEVPFGCGWPRFCQKTPKFFFCFIFFVDLVRRTVRIEYGR